MLDGEEEEETKNKTQLESKSLLLCLPRHFALVLAIWPMRNNYRMTLPLPFLGIFVKLETKKKLKKLTNTGPYYILYYIVHNIQAWYFFNRIFCAVFSFQRSAFIVAL